MAHELIRGYIEKPSPIFPGFNQTIFVITPRIHFINIYDWGEYKVVGSVYINPTSPPPYPCKVRLYCRNTARFIAQVSPDYVTGEYIFNQVRQGPWTVVVVDLSGTYNAVVADNVTAVPI